MADETRTILIDVEVENKDFDKEIGEVNTQLKKNREEIKELSKDYQENSTEIAKLESENRDLTKSKQALIKESKTEAGSLDALRLKTASLTKERNALDTSTDEGKRRLAELNAELKENTDQLKETEEAGGDYRRSVGDYAKANEGASGFIKGLWTTLAANPLLLIAGLFAGLIKIFSETQAGAEFLRKATATLNTALGFLKDIVEEVGVFLIDAFSNPQQAIEDFANLIKDNIINRFEGLLELIPSLAEAFTLLFKGQVSAAGELAVNAVAKVALGVEDMTGKIEAGIESVKNFSAEVAAGAEAAFALEQALIANEKAQADLLVQQAQSIESQKALNLIIEDQTLPLEERIRAAEEFQQVEADQLSESIRLAEERIDILKAQNDITNSTEEDIQRVRDAEIELANLKAASAERELTNQTKKNTLTQQQEAALTAQIKEEQKRRSEAFDKSLKADEDAHKESMEKQLKLVKDSLNEQVLADERANKLKEAANQEQFKLFELSERAKLKLAETGVGAAVSMLAEGFGFGKIVAIAEAIINTATGVTMAWRQGGVFGFIGAGVVAAAGAIQIAKIKATKIPGGKSSSSGSSSGQGVSRGGASRPSASRNVPAQVTNNARVEALNSLTSENLLLDRPIQVAVTDINTAQDKRAVKVTETQLA